MSGERRGYPGDYYAKEWDPVFLTDRNFKEDESYVEKKRRIDAEGNDISIFLRDSEDSVPSCKVHEVEEFCQDARLDHLKFGVGTAGQRRAAWLDDRRFSLLMSGGCVREYQNPLTATGLYRLLKEPRFQNGDLADANRRLIYIPNLDPNFILALAETASFHQVSALRDAIWKHLAFQTSIRVKIPPKGYPIFQMELHIPYFALREYPSPTKDRRQEVAAGKRPPRQWTDLSFLNIQTPKFQDKRKYGTCKARFSLIICGSDHRRWVGYAFVDRDFDSEELEEDDFSYEGIQEDPIASNGELDANLPIWDPREYFLMIFDIQMAKVLKEWENLVRAVERCINEHVC
ncbi:hypothetical protein K432DRAFT_307150 [Lepidopterella palustris CBS 459.81]|uniref:Uncharacterized protein n=1 Tax=Lepidopterella palustris CBS 459.81 TaxID=1314670 RepID=A0A8E2JB33_9PEZI|nr:hypothetical protein K432DRAFT_307150 [Lepidopterella palustris CBS 459.81]